MKKFIVGHVWWITLLFAIIMLVAHSLSYDLIKVDYTSIILLIVICFSPFISAITKIKVGDFEAEINPEEVKRIKEEVSKQVTDSNELTSNPEVINVIENITELAKTDPVIALAKLRIELEKLLSKLYRITHKKEEQKRPLSIGYLVSRLSTEEILPTDIAKSTREVISICNRALHGEDIRQEDAISVAESGGALLFEISFLTSENILEPVEVVEIDKAALENFWGAKYRVTTVTPYVEQPQKSIRIVDQEGLDELLEGYHEYAEFIVEVTKVDTPLT